VPNRFTVVPERPVPPAGPRLGPVVWVADLFMSLMLSRPGGLSLRVAWVTPATLWLSVVCAPALAALAVVLVRSGSAVETVVAAALCLVAAGSAAVAVVGIAQHRGRVARPG
jgi:hypothetical protein